MLGDDRVKEAAQLRLRGGRSDAVAEAAHHEEEVVVPPGPLLLAEAHRHPHLRPGDLGPVGHAEASGQDSHHRGRDAVQSDGPAHDGRVPAEPLLPELRAQHRDRLPVGAVVLGQDQAAPERTDAEHGEEVPARPLEVHLRRLVGEVQQAGADADGRELGHAGGEPREVEVVERRKGAGVEVGRAPIDGDDPVGRLEREPLHQRPVHRAGDGGGRSEAEGDAGDGGERDDGGALETAERAANLAEAEGAHGWSSLSGRQDRGGRRGRIARSWTADREGRLARARYFLRARNSESVWTSSGLSIRV